MNAKETILYHLRKEFYEKGFNKTTLKKIAELADVNPALVNYHFKSKEQLISEIHTDYFERIYARLDEERYSYLNLTNPLQKHAVAGYIYYNNIFRDENNIRFFYETLSSPKSKLTSYTQRDFLDKIFGSYIQTYNISIAAKEYLITCYMQAGAKINFLIRHIEGWITDISVSDINYYAESIMPRLLGVNTNEIDSCFLKAEKIVSEIEYDDLYYLVEDEKIN